MSGRLSSNEHHACYHGDTNPFSLRVRALVCARVYESCLYITISLCVSLSRLTRVCVWCLLDRAAAALEEVELPQQLLKHRFRMSEKLYNTKEALTRLAEGAHRRKRRERLATSRRSERSGVAAGGAPIRHCSETNPRNPRPAPKKRVLWNPL